MNRPINVKMNPTFDEKMMERCLQLAQLGRPLAFPNPLVGAVIVHKGKIIGEGYHAKCGEAHAEVNAVHSVKDKNLLSKSTIYVSLEPCSHFGKTPPCADLIVNHRFQRVVVGTIDRFNEVSGKGIERIRNAGIQVDLGFREKECQSLNDQFFHFHQRQMPYVFLKWAQTNNGFIDTNRKHKGQKPLKISNSHSSRWVHQMRSQVDGILVGSRTYLMDQPKLSTRLWPGKSPIRIIIDPVLETFGCFQDPLEDTLVFHSSDKAIDKPNSFIYISKDRWSIKTILQELYLRGLQSILVEGGAYTLERFIEEGFWNKAYQIISSVDIKDGVKAPFFRKTSIFTHRVSNDFIKIYYNEDF